MIKDNDGNVTGTYITNAADCDAEASFVEVTTDQVGTGDDAQVDFYFAGIVGAIGEAFPRGYAIAEFTRGFCNTPPMMMCALEQGAGGQTFSTPQDFWNAVENYELLIYVSVKLKDLSNDSILWEENFIGDSNYLTQQGDPNITESNVDLETRAREEAISYLAKDIARKVARD